MEAKKTMLIRQLQCPALIALDKANKDSYAINLNSQNVMRLVSPERVQPSSQNHQTNEPAFSVSFP